MASRKQLLVEVTFHEEGKSCRKAFPNLANRTYCPHFIVKGTEMYLGVCFVEEIYADLGTKLSTIVETIYDNVDYSLLLITNAEFDIAEGGNIVGNGKVIKLIEC